MDECTIIVKRWILFIHHILQYIWVHNTDRLQPFRPKDIEILWMNELINILWMTFILLGLRKLKKTRKCWWMNELVIMGGSFSSDSVTWTRPGTFRPRDTETFVDEWTNQHNVDDIHPSWSQEQEILKFRWMNELLNELGSVIWRMLFSDKKKTGNLQAERFGNYVDEWSKVYGMK